jgi:hypothetical protein
MPGSEPTVPSLRDHHRLRPDVEVSERMLGRCELRQAASSPQAMPGGGGLA